jgi:hypothetical protein
MSRSRSSGFGCPMIRRSLNRRPYSGRGTGTIRSTIRGWGSNAPAPGLLIVTLSLGTTASPLPPTSAPTFAGHWRRGSMADKPIRPRTSSPTSEELPPAAMASSPSSDLAARPALAPAPSPAGAEAAPKPKSEDHSPLALAAAAPPPRPGPSKPPAPLSPKDQAAARDNLARLEVQASRLKADLSHLEARAAAVRAELASVEAERSSIIKAGQAPRPSSPAVKPAAPPGR